MGSWKKISLKLDDLFDCLMLLNNGVKDMLFSFSFMCGIFLLFLFPTLHPLISWVLYYRSYHSECTQNFGGLLLDMSLFAV